MTARKRSIKSDLAKVDAHRITKAEYDEAPELTKTMLDRAEIRHGGKTIRRGRPPLENPKEAVKLRLDHDVLVAYRKTGRGWQTRINADLRKAARKREPGIHTDPWDGRPGLRARSSPDRRAIGRISERSLL